MTHLTHDELAAVLQLMRPFIERDDMAVIESSNPGPVGHDTGFEFTGKDGKKVRVLARAGESRSEAIKRVKARHGM